MPPKLSASIVILAWNAWSETEACLSALPSTLRPGDEVIVVDNGSRDETPERLPAYPLIEVVTNAENRGFAAGCNQGADLATREVLVFLNNDTVPSGDWLDRLLEPLEDPTVVAAGPRSNFASGPQLVTGADYAAGDRHGLDDFVASWSAAHRSASTETTRLVGFCLAVRKSAFDEVGGFDEAYEIGGYEDDDLCRRLSSNGGRLVIAHASYVHHSGHRTFDANDVDWVAQELHNRDRFVAKFGLSAPAPAHGPVELLQEASLKAREGDAAATTAVLLDLARDRRVAGPTFVPLAELLLGSGHLGLAEVVGRLDDDALRHFCGNVLTLEPARADTLLEVCDAALPRTVALLATAASLAVRLPIERALVWSARLREAGYADACPLVAAGMAQRSCADRARAGAAALGLFGDERGRDAALTALALAPAAEQPRLVEEVVTIAPQLSAVLIAGDSVTPDVRRSDADAREIPALSLAGHCDGDGDANPRV